MKVKNQTLIEILGFIRLSGFHFSYSFQGFRIPLFCHLLTLQRYEVFLNYANIFKIVFKKISTFFKENLLGMDIIPIFATSKFKVRYDAAGSEPAFFVPSYLGSKTTAPCRPAETPRRSRTLSLDNTSCSFFMSKYQSVMNQTIRLGQVVQPSMLSRVESIVKNCKEWLSARSKTFSALCGEDFTHKEVLLANAACVLLIVACGVAEWLEGGAL